MRRAACSRHRVKRHSPALPRVRIFASSFRLPVASVQAVLFALLAWAALLCAGLGGTAGGASQTFANKLVPNFQHLQRHGGTSLASRAVRRDQSAVRPVQHVR